jgi:hypothetical protein
MNITQIVKKQGLQFDRHLDSTFALPVYDFEEIKIQPNDVATATVINGRLKKLYENFVYLYKSTRVASNIIPVSSIAIAGVSASTNDNLTWKRNLSSNSFTQMSYEGFYGENNIRDIAVVSNKDLDRYSIFFSTGKDIVVYNSDTEETTLTFALCTNQLAVNYNVKWQDIVDIEFGDKNQMYVLDVSANKVAKYDVSGFTTDDTILNNRLVFKESIGGYGTYDDKLLFNTPRALTIHDTSVYVLDSGNGCIKKYDENLNWQITYRLFRDFLSAYPVDMASDVYGYIYVLTQNGYILKYDNDFLTKETINLLPLSSAGETFKQISFSPTEPNIGYITTNKSIYKITTAKGFNIIGTYLFYLNNINTNENLLSFSSLQYGTNDKNFVFSTNGTRGILRLYYDNLNLYDVLAIKDFDVYSFEDIEINRSEYLQNWVFNKAIAKLLINHMRLRDQITGKFQARKDMYGNLVLQGTRYLLPEEQSILSFQQDITHFIGANEIFQNNIVNRCLKKLFDIQNDIYNTLIIDKKYVYDTSAPVII